MTILEVHNLKKIYTTRFGGNPVQALSQVSFSVEEGEYVAIMGESGSGKTTLLNILAALDKPTSGEVLLGGRSLSTLKEKELAAFRRENLGFVFQDFNLLDTFSLKDNIFLPLVLSGKGHAEMEARLSGLARKLGHHGAAFQISLRGFRWTEAAGRCRPGVDHWPSAHPGRRTHRRPGFPRGRQPAAAIWGNQRRRSDHPYGDPQHPGCQQCPPGAVYQRWRGIPSAVPRGPVFRRAVSKHLRHPDPACHRRCAV